MRSTERGTRNEEEATDPVRPEPKAVPAASSVLVPRSSSSHPGTVQSERFSFWYGPKQALHEITLTMAARSITALIGPSGCGKSTFLRSINRLNELIPGTRHTGSLELDGENIYDKGTDAVALRQRTGMVFQRWNPFPK